MRNAPKSRHPSVDPCLTLGRISTARASSLTTRDVKVDLDRASIEYTASSQAALPHGADFRVLLALAEHASDDSAVQVPVAELLRDSHPGAGGRQHAALFAACTAS